MSTNLGKKVTKRFRLRVEKWEDRQVQLWYDSLIYELDIWYNDVTKALSVPLQGSKHGVTGNRSRLFPYYRGGDKHRSPLLTAFHEARLDAHTTAKGNKSVNVHVVVDDNTALYTNKGLNAPANAPAGAWVGWYDDIFNKSGGRGTVEKSVRDIFSDAARKRAKL